MNFHINFTSQDKETIIELTDKKSGCSLEIYSYGAILNKFSIPLVNHKAFNIKDSYDGIEDAKKRLATWFNGARLSPFVCRLKNGEYCIENQIYKVQKFYMGKHAIHGLVFDASYDIETYTSDNEMATVTLHYRYEGIDKGYPFIFDSYITYTLKKDNRIFISSRIVNASDTAIPFNEGWHPYFNLEGKSNEWNLTINSNTIVEFDNEMIPTGALKTNNNFITSNKIGDTHLDECYFIYDNTTPACVLSNDKISLNIYPEESMPYLQVFTPDHRNNIAIECLSSAPNSFNNRFGLKWIQPQESATYNTMYQLKKEGE